MADADDVRRLALALPHVEEIDSDGFDFRVADKGFVWSYPERRPGKPRVIRTDIAVLFVGDEAEKQALLLGEPELVLHHARLRRLAAGHAAAGAGGRSSGWRSWSPTRGGCAVARTDAAALWIRFVSALDPSG